MVLDLILMVVASFAGWTGSPSCKPPAFTRGVAAPSPVALFALLPRRKKADPSGLFRHYMAARALLESAKAKIFGDQGRSRQRGDFGMVVRR